MIMYIRSVSSTTLSSEIPMFVEPDDRHTLESGVAPRNLSEVRRQFLFVHSPCPGASVRVMLDLATGAPHCRTGCDHVLL